MSNYVAGAAIDKWGSILMKINAFIPVRMSSSHWKALAGINEHNR